MAGSPDFGAWRNGALFLNTTQVLGRYQKLKEEMELNPDTGLAHWNSPPEVLRAVHDRRKKFLDEMANGGDR